MHITKSEKRVLELLYLTNSEIANFLYVEISTVKEHVHNLLVKFKAKTRTELYKKYMEMKLMYKLKVKDNIFTIPKQNIRLLAIAKAMDLKSNVELKTDEQAIKYLESIGIKVLKEQTNEK